MQIQGLTKTTLLDYPGRVACTIFFGGCNFRCPFCYNTPLVLHPETQPVLLPQEVLGFLKKRRGILEGVCVTGGEPTLSPELPGFLADIKSLGYSVKLDSNGYRPDVIESLLRDSLVDYIAMDIKTSPAHYPEVAGVPDLDVARIEKSVSLIMESGVGYEFRTTVVRQFHSEAVFREIAPWLAGCSAYYLQSFKDTGETISPGLDCYSVEELRSFVDILHPLIPNTNLRGVD